MKRPSDYAVRVAWFSLWCFTSLQLCCFTPLYHYDYSTHWSLVSLCCFPSLLWHCLALVYHYIYSTHRSLFSETAWALPVPSRLCVYDTWPSELGLSRLHSTKVTLRVCGDINTDCITESNRKNLVLLLTTYSILHTVSLATGLQNNSSTATDSIFVDNSRINLSSLSPTINDLSVHDAHIFTINEYTYLCNNKKFLLYKTWITLLTFRNLASYI